MRLYICPFKDCDHFASSDGYHCGTHGNRLELNKEITPTNPPLASGDSKDSPHQLCNGAWAIPPSPLMLKHGNSYYSCSVCGEPCVEPAYVNSETSSVKSMSTDSPQPAKGGVQKRPPLSGSAQQQSVDEQLDDALTELADECYAANPYDAIFDHKNKARAAIRKLIDQDKKVINDAYLRGYNTGFQKAKRISARDPKIAQSLHDIANLITNDNDALSASEETSNG